MYLAPRGAACAAQLPSSVLTPPFLARDGLSPCPLFRCLFCVCVIAVCRRYQWAFIRVETELRKLKHLPTSTSADGGPDGASTVQLSATSVSAKLSGGGGAAQHEVSAAVGSGSQAPGTMHGEQLHHIKHTTSGSSAGV